MNIEDVHRVLIVGAGTMGQQIGLQCATHGFSVTLCDAAEDALEAAMSRVRIYAAQMVESGTLTSDEANAALARIVAIGDPAK